MKNKEERKRLRRIEKIRLLRKAISMYDNCDSNLAKGFFLTRRIAISNIYSNIALQEALYESYSIMDSIMDNDCN